MGNLLKAEFRNLMRQKSLYICIVIVVLLVAMPIIVFSLEDIENIQNLSTELFLSSFAVSGIDMILPVLIALLVCNDYNSGAIRLIIGRGYGRTAVYCSKFITAFVVTVILAIISWCSAEIFIFIFLDCTVILTQRIFLILLIQIIAMFVIGAIACLVAILSRKSSVAITVGFLMPPVGTIVISLIDSLFNIEQFRLINYWALSFLTDLSSVTVTNNEMLHCAVISFACIVVVFFAGWLRFRRCDV